MRHRDDTRKDRADKTVRDICRATRRRFASEEKIRIVLDGLRGEDSIAELCRREGINQNAFSAAFKRTTGQAPREMRAAG